MVTGRDTLVKIQRGNERETRGRGEEENNSLRNNRQARNERAFPNILGMMMMTMTMLHLVSFRDLVVSLHHLLVCIVAESCLHVSVS